MGSETEHRRRADLVRVRWVDELPPKRTGTDQSRGWGRIVSQLKKQPGRWALLMSNTSSRHWGDVVDRYGIELAVRKNPGGDTWNVYGRWPMAKREDG